MERLELITDIIGWVAAVLFKCAFVAMAVIVWKVYKKEYGKKHN